MRGVYKRGNERRKLWKLLPVVRAIAVLSAVGILTTVVTFAAIQSSGSALTGNTIQTATATLQISNNNTTWNSDVGGWNFNGVVPGGPARPIDGSYVVYIKNTGNAPMTLSMTVKTPPSVTGAVDLSGVHVVLTPTSGGASQALALSDLLAGNVAIAGSTIQPYSGPGTALSYKIQVSMDADAVTGSTASITGLNLTFIGTV